MVDEFIKKIESMYGQYRPAYKVAVKNVLNTMPQDAFDTIMQNLLIKYKSEYNQPPSIPTLMEMAGMTLDNEAEKEWIVLRNVSDIVSVLITNPRTQAVVESYGGWYNFCQQRDENEYTHKDFIERYKTVTPAEKPKVLRGYADYFWNSDIDYSRVKIIGDYQKGTILLAQIEKKEIDKMQNEIENLINKTIKYIE